MQDESLADLLIMADLFVQRFVSFFRNFAIQNPFPNQVCNNNNEPSVITPESIELVLSSLHLNSSMGGYGLHPRLLINLSLELSVPVCILFQTSFEIGVLPDLWLRFTSYCIDIQKGQ